MANPMAASSTNEAGRVISNASAGAGACAAKSVCANADGGRWASNASSSGRSAMAVARDGTSGMSGSSNAPV